MKLLVGATQGQSSRSLFGGSWVSLAPSAGGSGRRSATAEFLTACSADVDVDNSDVQDKRDSHQPEPPAFVMSLYCPFQIRECSVVGRKARGLSEAPLSSSGQTSMPSIGRGDPFMVTVSAEETPTRLQSVGSDKARSAAASEGVEGKQARHATETHTSRRRA